jgi:ribonuclease D
LKLEEVIEIKKPDFFDGDLSPERLQLYLSKPMISIDTETRGLNILRDRLCLTQLCDENGVVSIVRYRGPDAPNLHKLLEAASVIKLFHFARFDVAVLKQYLKANVYPLWCTKIASKVVRTYTDRHSLKDLVRELLGAEVDKSDQSSDWARDDLSESQMDYAANDVRVLIPIYQSMRAMLEREQRLPLAERLFTFLPVQAELDLGGWKDVFEH